MGKRSVLSRLLSHIFKKGGGQKASRAGVPQALAGNFAAEKLLLEMKFGKR